MGKVILPLLRELVLGPVLQYSGWSMADVWTNEKDEKGFYTKVRSTVDRIHAQVQRLQILLDVEKSKSIEAAKKAKKAEEDEIKRSEALVYAEYLKHKGQEAGTAKGAA